MTQKEQILAALQAFIEQRAGIDPRNYGSWADYRREAREVTRDRHDAERLLRDIELRDSITADDILQAARGGRLSIEVRPVYVSGKVAVIPGHHVRDDIRVDYCTGQYFPTEYRKAAARLAASVLWNWKRDHAMPEGSRQGATEGAILYPTGKGFVSAGSWLRASFAREYGRAIASRYFN